MRKPKRRIIRISYGSRVKSRSKRQKVAPSGAKQGSSSPDTSKSQGASSPLATFDSACNPYQQFVDNLSINLANLPQEAFTKTAESSADARQEEAEESPLADLDPEDDLPAPPPPYESQEEIPQAFVNEQAATTSEDANKLINNRPTLPTEPSLQNVLGIASCLLASNH